MGTSISPCLMAAAVACGGAGQAGDLMHDFKAGLMMRLSPRKQLLAQLMGRGLHSSIIQLNLSAFCGIGGAWRRRSGCLEDVRGC